MLDLVPPISAIIVDHENIPVSQELEKLVKSKTKYPLGIKIAIANFTNRDKCTKRLHEEGYVQLNVPQFNNSADAQVIILGCFFFLSHPNLKQIFICSKDRIFEHLKNALLKFGIEVILINNNPLESPKENTNKEKKSKSKKKSEISLKQKILILLEEIAVKRDQREVLVSQMCSEFAKKHGEPISTSIKKTHSKKKVITYLRKHGFVILQDSKKQYSLSISSV